MKKRERTRKIPAMTLWDKEPAKIVLSSLLLPIYCLACSCLRVLHFSSETPLEKIQFSWGMGKCPLLPLALGPSGAAPCRSYACCLGLWESLWVCPVVFRRPVSLVLSNPLALAPILPPLQRASLSLEGRDLSKALIYECSRIMFWVVLLLHSFSRTVALVYSLAPQAISFQLLGHSSSVVNMLHPMEWAFSQIGC